MSGSGEKRKMPFLCLFEIPQNAQFSALLRNAGAGGMGGSCLSASAFLLQRR